MNPVIKKTDSQPMLEVNQITRRFGGLVAVNEVNFSVNNEEIFGLIGPNGAGKTTLFNLITGLIEPSSGQIFSQSQLISQLKPHQIAAKGIARTFQNIRLFGELSALENVIVGRHLHTKSNFVTGILGFPQANQAEKQAKQKAKELIELVGLGDRVSEKGKNLSYGDQRRLEIARALALEPSILLLDEPAAGMNPNEKQVLSTFIRDLRTQFNLTIILIEHHVPLVMGLCDRIAVLNFGKLIALGQPEIVRNDLAVIEAYLGVD